MAEVVLFHHVQGLTDGVNAFAEALRAGGHTVHTPDLFEGNTFDSIDEGMAFRNSHTDQVQTDADRAIAEMPAEVVYAGTSFGASVAQEFGQKRPGARGILLYEGCIPITGEWAFGPWPDGLPVQIHGAEGDEFFAEDLPAAQEIVTTLGPKLAELFVYPGSAHLFTDSSLPAYDADATAQVQERTLAFLDHVG